MLKVHKSFIYLIATDLVDIVFYSVENIQLILGTVIILSKFKHKPDKNVLVSVKKQKYCLKLWFSSQLYPNLFWQFLTLKHLTVSKYTSNEI